jgi:hypothetical protein
MRTTRSSLDSCWKELKGSSLGLVFRQISVPRTDRSLWLCPEAFTSSNNLSKLAVLKLNGRLSFWLWVASAPNPQSSRSCETEWPFLRLDCPYVSIISIHNIRHITASHQLYNKVSVPWFWWTLSTFDSRQKSSRSQEPSIWICGCITGKPGDWYPRYPFLQHLI